MRAQLLQTPRGPRNNGPCRGVRPCVSPTRQGTPQPFLPLPRALLPNTGVLRTAQAKPCRSLNPIICGFRVNSCVCHRRSCVLCQAVSLSALRALSLSLACSSRAASPTLHVMPHHHPLSLICAVYSCLRSAWITAHSCVGARLMQPARASLPGGPAHVLSRVPFSVV
jgi:hypothetical protein